jgi:hypothetical protein
MRILLISIFTFSASAFACPDLTGTFECNWGDGSNEVVTISQSMQNGVTTYLYNGFAVPADSMTYSLPDEEYMKNAVFSAWCENTTILNIRLRGKLYENGSHIGDTDTTANFFKHGANLVTSTLGDFKGTDGTVQPINVTTTCNPK